MPRIPAEELSRRPARHRDMPTFTATVLVTVLLTTLAGCGSPAPPSSKLTSETGLTNRERTAALHIAQHESRQPGWDVAVATAWAGAGPSARSNTGQRCRSRTLLHITLIGKFANVAPAASSQAPLPKPERRGGAVHGVLLTVDSRSGNVCLIAVRTGDVRPDPQATVLFRRS